MAEPQPSPVFRRKIIVVKRALQIKYVALLFLSVLLTAALVLLDVYYVFGKVFIADLGSDRLAELFKSTAGLLAVHVALYGLAAALLALFVSHKFAGPLFRLERVAESLASGDLTAKAVLRKGDDLFETAEAVNRMIESFREKVMQDKNLSGRIAKRLEEVASRLKSGDLSLEQALPILEELKTESGHIGTHFKL